MDVVVTPEQPQTPVEDSGSLSDHERSYHERQSAPSAVEETPPPAAKAEPAGDAAPEVDDERDEQGRFKPRHRAKSQQASPEDVPRIRELTKRLREREAEIEGLRQASASYRQPEPPKAEPTKPAAAAHGFPTFDVWAAEKDNEGKSFEDFIDARTEWKYRALRESERADEAKTAAARAHQKRVDAYVEKLDAIYEQYPDFDAVVNPPEGPIRVSNVVEHAVLEVGPAVAYYLATHPEERDALTEETAIDPNNPAFPAAVAAMRRYLSTLVASPQRSSSSPSRQAAVSTGSAPARVPVPVPRPPNPVRTAALRDGDQPPGDEGSLADHEKAYWTRRRA